MRQHNLNIIISGGGTGGHIFPALAIADEFKKRYHDHVNITFVGALGKLEMTKVPQHGYPIIGLDIRGIQRALTIKNLVIPFKALASLWKSVSILRKINPDVVIGVGGYASGPLLQAASWLGYPYFIQEQNSYPGITNKWLAPKARLIFSAYDNLDQFFPKQKLVLCGNPVRKSILDIQTTTKDYRLYNLDPNKKTLLILGGSLGARTINESVSQHLTELLKLDLQIIWQTGKTYFEPIHKQHTHIPNVKIVPFIEDMNMAYALADIIVSRAGALSISELCLVGKPVIFIPSPNVAEDHQTKNALNLVEKQAALLLMDMHARKDLFQVIQQLYHNPEQQKNISQNILKLAKPNATEHIVDQILKNINRGTT